MARLHLYSNWRDILKHAWSMRFIALAFLFTVAEVALPFFSDEFPPRLFGVLSGLSAAAAFVSRLVAQKDV
jgi:hypothetical protein